MKYIPSLTADPRQSIKLVAPDGNLITLTFEFVESQRGWFFSMDYLNLTLSRRRLTNSPNLLRQFRGIIPFGLTCAVTDGQEPVFKDDFVSGRVQMYILDQPDDITAMEAFIRT